MVDLATVGMIVCTAIFAEEAGGSAHSQNDSRAPARVSDRLADGLIRGRRCEGVIIG
jgi:hypothetical protein